MGGVPVGDSILWNGFVLHPIQYAFIQETLMQHDRRGIPGGRGSVSQNNIAGAQYQRLVIDEAREYLMSNQEQPQQEAQREDPKIEYIRSLDRYRSKHAYLKVKDHHFLLEFTHRRGRPSRYILWLRPGKINVGDRSYYLHYRHIPRRFPSSSLLAERTVRDGGFSQRQFDKLALSEFNPKAPVVKEMIKQLSRKEGYMDYWKFAWKDISDSEFTQGVRNEPEVSDE